MSRVRVVITGLSCITPLANDLATTWQRLIAGESGIGPLDIFDASAYTSRIAGLVKDFNPDQWMTPKQAKHMDRFTQLAVATSKMLLEDANFKIDANNATEVGAYLGGGIGGLQSIETWHKKLLEAGPNKITPFLIPMFILNMAPGQIAIHTGAKGPNVVCSTACASALHAIGHAYDQLLLGRVQVAITGGVEAAITPLSVAGFTAIKALSTHYNDTPTKASRPFDSNRDGFVMGEGCGLLLLETLDSALARGAKIYAEMVGFGASADAYHMTAPSEDGEGMILAMRKALKDANISPDAVSHVNAHGTSTKINDQVETLAIKEVFGSHAKNLKISATKSMTGHLLGAAGGIEAVFTAMALHDEILPGTINLENPDPACDLDYVSSGSEKVACEYAICNSFGFGGTNACVVFKKWPN